MAGIIYVLRSADLQGQVIVAILFAGSILAWSVMIAKAFELREAARASARFLGAYRKESTPTALFLKRKRFDASPLYAVYERTCGALGAALEATGGNPEDLFMGGVGASHRVVGERQLATVRNMADRTVPDQALRLEGRMGWLATAVSAAPFLGLLGTVWGVMNAFSSMHVTGAAMLSSVAPGISAALVTTVVGLMVALPSAVGYNLLGEKIRRLNLDMENFVEELMSDIDSYYRLEE